jgi:hypothetical protein
MQIAEQVPAETSSATAHGSSWVQSDVTGQAPGEPDAMAMSQVLPGSTIPFPHVGEQSESVAAVAPAGQQPSFGATTVITSCAQAAVQSAPLGVSRVQATPSLQSAGGHAPGSPVAMAVSQVSP